MGKFGDYARLFTIFKTQESMNNQGSMGTCSPLWDTYSHVLGTRERSQEHLPEDGELFPNIHPSENVLAIPEVAKEWLAIPRLLLR